MLRDIDIGGVLVSPFVAYALGAFAILLVLRRLFSRTRRSRRPGSMSASSPC